ncbi:hypothetical protein BY996DRAFT_8440644, partial [Phakopsora pachyrhizi]
MKTLYLSPQIPKNNGESRLVTEEDDEHAEAEANIKIGLESTIIEAAEKIRGGGIGTSDGKMTTNPPANRSTLFRVVEHIDPEAREYLRVAATEQTAWRQIYGNQIYRPIPTINPNQIKIKSSSERCKVYSKGLSELENCMTGLDLWVWIKTAGKNDEGCVKDRNEDQESSLLTPIFATNNNYIH